MSFCNSANDKVCKPPRKEKFHESEDLIRRRCKVPDGLKEILTLICKETIRNQPPDIPAFIASLLNEEIKKRSTINLNMNTLDEYLENSLSSNVEKAEKLKMAHYKAAPNDLIRDKRTGAYAMQKLARDMSRQRSTTICEGANRVVDESRIMSITTNMSEDVFMYLRDTVTGGAASDAGLDRHDQLAALTERYLTMEQRYNRTRQEPRKPANQPAANLPKPATIGDVMLVGQEVNVGVAHPAAYVTQNQLNVNSVKKEAVSGSSSLTGEVADNLELPSTIENTKVEIGSEISDSSAYETSRLDDAVIPLPSNTIPSDDWTDMLMNGGEVSQVNDSMINDDDQQEDSIVKDD